MTQRGPGGAPPDSGQVEYLALTFREYQSSRLFVELEELFTVGP